MSPLFFSPSNLISMQISGILNSAAIFLEDDVALRGQLTAAAKKQVCPDTSEAGVEINWRINGLSNWVISPINRWAFRKAHLR